jgi:hypothetical protein
MRAPMADELTPQELQALRRSAMRASEQGWGIAVGLLLGFGLLVATLFLVIRGGPNPGPHLGLLRIYFPGFSVTWFGGLIGFVYAFVIGYAIGRTVATIYNRLIPPGS